MHATTKIGLALGAAALLLVGGLATTARWSDSTTSSSTTITTGHLRISDGTTGDWTDVSVTPPTPFDPATEFLVPGDLVEADTVFVVDAEGSNLRARVATSFGNGAALPDGITATVGAMTLDPDGTGPAAASSFDPATDTIRAGEGQLLTVPVRVGFGLAATGSQNRPVDLRLLEVVVTQARR